MELEIITRKPDSKARKTPLLFVHGMSLGAWAWDEHFLPFFAENGYEAHALSLRYHAGSGDNGKVRWVPISAYVEDVKKVMANFNTPPILIGHSMGGMIVQMIARDQQIAGLVTLGSAPPGGLWPTMLRLLVNHPWLMLKTNVMLSLKPFLLNPNMTPKLFFSGGMSKADSDRYFDMLCNESFRAFIDLLLPRSGIGKHCKPVLVMGADNDPTISRNMLRATATSHGTKAVSYPGSGHTIMLDVEREKFATHILGWLDSNNF